MDRAPLLIRFVPGTALYRERDRASDFPILRNGPPGTFVLFPHGLRVSLPTDQIVRADDDTGAVRAVFGGMRFVGLIDDRLNFVREREMYPETALSPERSRRMTLEPAWVAAIFVDGQPVWP